MDVSSDQVKEKEEVLSLLRSSLSERKSLFDRADNLRQQIMGEEVFLRGIVELSNICANHCHYCGIRAPNKKVVRYRMSDDEVLDVAHKMKDWQQTTIVLQAGEVAKSSEDEKVGELIKRIKKETGLAITISLGNRSRDTYKYWQDCGMDRMLLRFETSDPALFDKIHPDCSYEERLECLHILKDLGVQVGSGFMIGLPGETLETLADNIMLCRDLALDMIGIGPFIPHPDTPLGTETNIYQEDPEMFFVALSALRLANPYAHIPATTAFDAFFKEVNGRDLCLQRGANVYMPNNTPEKFKQLYFLYPDKPLVDEAAAISAQKIIDRLTAMGRLPGKGPGHALRMRGK